MLCLVCWRFRKPGPRSEEELLRWGPSLSLGFDSGRQQPMIIIWYYLHIYVYNMCKQLRQSLSINHPKWKQCINNLRALEPEHHVFSEWNQLSMRRCGEQASKELGAKQQNTGMERWYCRWLWVRKPTNPTLSAFFLGTFDIWPVTKPQGLCLVFSVFWPQSPKSIELTWDTW